MIDLALGLFLLCLRAYLVLREPAEVIDLEFFEENAGPVAQLVRAHA
jgi:hypothetical protein